MLALALASGQLTGCKLEDKLGAAISEIDGAETTITQLSDAWRGELPGLVQSLQGLESQVDTDSRVVLTDAVSQVQQLANQTVALSASEAADVVARAGAEFRCDGDFVKTGALQTLQHLSAELKFWQKNRRQLDDEPVHSVCWVNPSVLALTPNGAGWSPVTGTMADQGVVHVYGYNFRADAVPAIELDDADGKLVRAARLTASYVTRYQIDVDLSTEDFAGIAAGARLRLVWPDKPDPNTITLTLHTHAQLGLSSPVLTPAGPTAGTTPVTLRVTVANTGGTASDPVVVTWQPDPQDGQRFSITVSALNAGDSTELTFPGNGSYLYRRSDPRIVSTVSLSNGAAPLLLPVTVAAAPPTPMPERDLPGFPVGQLTSYGNYAGGYGADPVFGGRCTSGYVRTTRSVVATQAQNATVEDKGWLSNDPTDCRFRVHISIKASFPTPAANSITIRVDIREKGQ